MTPAAPEGRRWTILSPDPWRGLCLAAALPGARVISYGGLGHAAMLRAVGAEPVVVPPVDEPTSTRLLDEPAARAALDTEPAALVALKPSARLDERAAALGAWVALADTALSRRLENKLTLGALAAEAGVSPPRSERVSARPDAWPKIVAALGADVVAQSPRGFMGKRTFRVRSAQGWTELCADLRGRPLKVSRWIEGRPGTSNAVVDSRGAVVVTAPIVQVTGDPRLTPFALGSCGNDFTWRPGPVPQDSEELCERLGAALARRGYRGHFGVDWIADAGGRCHLIEINPRPTASLPLYAAWRPELLAAHLRAVCGAPVEPRRLAPLGGGQLILNNLGASPQAPPALDGASPLPGDVGSAPCWWSAPGPRHSPGSNLGRIITRAVVVDESGALDAPLEDTLRRS